MTQGPPAKIKVPGPSQDFRSPFSVLPPTLVFLFCSSLRASFDSLKQRKSRLFPILGCRGTGPSGGFWLGTEAGGGLGGDRDELRGWDWAGPGRGECVTGWGPSGLMPRTSVLTLPPQGFQVCSLLDDGTRCIFRHQPKNNDLLTMDTS